MEVWPVSVVGETTLATISMKKLLFFFFNDVKIDSR